MNTKKIFWVNNHLIILVFDISSNGYNIIVKCGNSYYYYYYYYYYIYKTEAFETPTIFHVSTILKKKKTFLKPGIIKMKKKKHPKISAKKNSQKPKTRKFPSAQNQNPIIKTLSPFNANTVTQTHQTPSLLLYTVPSPSSNKQFPPCLSLRTCSPASNLFPSLPSFQAFFCRSNQYPL